MRHKAWRDTLKTQLPGVQLRAELRGGAAGKAAKGRKSAESASGLTAALTTFLTSWLESHSSNESDSRPPKRRHVQGPREWSAHDDERDDVSMINALRGN